MKVKPLRGTSMPLRKGTLHAFTLWYPRINAILYTGTPHLADGLGRAIVEDQPHILTPAHVLILPGFEMMPIGIDSR